MFFFLGRSFFSLFRLHFYGFAVCVLPSAGCQFSPSRWRGPAFPPNGFTFPFFYNAARSSFIFAEIVRRLLSSNRVAVSIEIYLSVRHCPSTAPDSLTTPLSSLRRGDRLSFLPSFFNVHEPSVFSTPPRRTETFRETLLLCGFTKAIF